MTCPAPGLTVPGPPLENVNTGGGAGIPPSPINIVPTVGIRSVLKPGILTTLRLDDPQANQTLRCDPNYAQGQEFSAFRYGCQPWYGKNSGPTPGGTRRRRHARSATSSSRTPIWATPSARTRRAILAVRPDRTGPLDRSDR